MKMDIHYFFRVRLLSVRNFMPRYAFEKQLVLNDVRNGKGPLSMLCLYVCLANLKGAYTLHKIFHGTEYFPRTACAVQFFLKKKLYCACGPQKIIRSVENFMKCICTFNLNFHIG